MAKRLDGLTDYEDLSPAQQAQARLVCARNSLLVAEDAHLFAYRITTGSRGVPAGIVSPSRKDLRPSTASEALLDALPRRRRA